MYLFALGFVCGTIWGIALVFVFALCAAAARGDTED